jgi:alanine dehydrogenase
MLIAVPAETDPGKGRVAATPETVKKFIGLGAKVVVQSGAGLASGILDADSGWPSAPSPSPARSSPSSSSTGG